MEPLSTSKRRFLSGFPRLPGRVKYGVPEGKIHPFMTPWILSIFHSASRKRSFLWKEREKGWIPADGIVASSNELPLHSSERIVDPIGIARGREGNSERKKRFQKERSSYDGRMDSKRARDLERIGCPMRLVHDPWNPSSSYPPSTLENPLGENILSWRWTVQGPPRRGPPTPDTEHRGGRWDRRFPHSPPPRTWYHHHHHQDESISIRTSSAKHAFHVHEMFVSRPGEEKTS